MSHQGEMLRLSYINGLYSDPDMIGGVSSLTQAISMIS